MKKTGFGSSCRGDESGPCDRLIRPAAVCVVLTCLSVLLASQVYSQPLAKGQSKFLGSSISTLFPSFTTYFNQLTPENEGKWGSVEGTQGSFNWTNLDNIYNLATSNRFPFKEHNLVWGNQQPGWIGSLDSATQRAEVERWIDTVGQRYPSMSMIDVVNEPFHAVPSYSNALGGNGKTGWDWVITAFQLARKYCFPGVKLLVNDYNILQDNTVTTNYIKLIDTLQVRGLIDGIGIQGHYFEFKGSGYTYSISTIRSNLNRLTALGLPVYISEFDINEANDSTQLANYQTYFPLFWENPGVKGITLWGYLQPYTWQTNAYLVRTDGSERPALQWLRIYVATPAVVSPLGQTNQPRDVSLVWHRSTPATSYRLQIAADSAFSSIVVDSTVTDTTLHVNPLAGFAKFYWRVSAVNSSGSSAFSTIASFVTGGQIMAVDDAPTLPKDFELLQNYPNPFNPSTEIRYDIPQRLHVKLSVFDMLGREVAILTNEEQSPGHYRMNFSAANLPSGVYFYELEAGNNLTVRKMLFLK